MNMIASRKFHGSVLRAGPSVAVVAGIVWALCPPCEARAQGGFNGPGPYEITNLKSGKVLDLDRNDQTSVIRFSSRGTDNQVWEIRPADSGFYYLQNTMNGNALEAIGTRNSTRVRVTEFSGGSSQKWRIGFLALATLAVAQVRTIGTGTSISMRTNETIDVKNSDGRVFTGVVDRDVTDANSNVAIPRGSNAELIVKKASNKDLALDLESVTVNGQRYAVTADASRMSSGQREGIGKNKRTAEFIGGSAAPGAIIGAIAGGGKGSAIGAAAAGAGAGTQVLTRGKAVKFPAESLLTFRLEQPLEMGAADSGFTRKGHHDHTSRLM